jgi:hypothetical protein
LKLGHQKSKTLAWHKREEALERETLQHYNLACSLFTILTEEDIAPGIVALPSTFQLFVSGDANYVRWCNVELELRVGIGHDLLHEIRNTTGLHSYYTRKQKKLARGYIEMKNVARSQKRLSADKSRLVQKYNSNWQHVEELIQLLSLTDQDRLHRLKGLRRLTRDDEISFLTTLEVRSKPPGVSTDPKPNWLWEVAMLEHPLSSSSQNQELLLSNWESEGENDFSRTENRCSLQQLKE